MQKSREEEKLIVMRREYDGKENNSMIEHVTFRRKALQIFLCD